MTTDGAVSDLLRRRRKPAGFLPMELEPFQVSRVAQVKFVLNLAQDFIVDFP